jgi:hypothetical protein
MRIMGSIVPALVAPSSLAPGNHPEPHTAVHTPLVPPSGTAQYPLQTSLFEVHAPPAGARIWHVLPLGSQ